MGQSKCKYRVTSDTFEHYIDGIFNVVYRLGAAARLLPFILRNSNNDTYVSNRVTRQDAMVKLNISDETLNRYMRTLAQEKILIKTNTKGIYIVDFKPLKVSILWRK